MPENCILYVQDNMSIVQQPMSVNVVMSPMQFKLCHQDPSSEILTRSSMFGIYVDIVAVNCPNIEFKMAICGNNIINEIREFIFGKSMIIGTIDRYIIHTTIPEYPIMMSDGVDAKKFSINGIKLIVGQLAQLIGYNDDEALAIVIAFVTKHQNDFSDETIHTTKKACIRGTN